MNETKNVPLRAEDMTLVLASLRAVQLLFDGSPDLHSICEWEMLNAEGIDSLCERINVTPVSGFDLDATERGTLYFALIMWTQWPDSHRYKRHVLAVLNEDGEADTSDDAARALRERLKDVITPAERNPLVA
ncbi:hypothetical protein [Thioalkalivibrio sp. ALE16]|uniref:hypothetical protein n=1 Tax=Thioalkalivibrio sp. ALE16 TaxID=1158172 RepID=UPI0003680BBA|nr:hypothetical protein [Thioalkalivibrio sp. ALE16]